MESFIFALEAVMPIVIMVAIGYFIKRIGFVKTELAKTVNKMVFRIFLPAMLFLNVYKIESLAEVELDYVLYSVIALISVFVLSSAKMSNRNIGWKRAPLPPFRAPALPSPCTI